MASGCTLSSLDTLVSGLPQSRSRPSLLARAKYLSKGGKVGNGVSGRAGHTGPGRLPLDTERCVDGRWKTTLDTELAEMMIQMFVH